MDGIYDSGVQHMTTSRDEVISGGAQLDTLLRTLPNNMQKNINRAALRAGAAVFLKEVKQNIPVKSGDLRKTARISGKIKDGVAVVSVKVGGKHKGVDAWYARLVEYGTRPHYIKVTDEDRGRNRRTGNLITMTTVNRRTLTIGGTIVGPSVHHPGSKKRPFMRPAVDSKFPEAIKAITAKVRERLAANGLNTPTPAPMDSEE